MEGNPEFVADLFDVSTMEEEFVPQPVAAPPSSTSAAHTSSQQSNPNGGARRQEAEALAEPTSNKTVIDTFPEAGRVHGVDQGLYTLWAEESTNASNPYHPFSSETDWRIARWAKKMGPGDRALSQLLAIPKVSHLA